MRLNKAYTYIELSEGKRLPKKLDDIFNYVFWEIDPAQIENVLDKEHLTKKELILLIRELIIWSCIE